MVISFVISHKLIVILHSDFEVVWGQTKEFCCVVCSSFPLNLSLGVISSLCTIVQGIPGLRSSHDECMR